MLWQRFVRRGSLCTAACLPWLVGCNGILGIDEPVPAQDTASSGSGGTGGTGANGGGTSTSTSTSSTTVACDPTESADPNGVFVSKLVGSPSGDGSPTSPFDTLAQALEAAAAKTNTLVYIAPGTYDGAVSLPAGVIVEGAWTLTAGGTWARDCAEGAAEKVRIVGPAGAPVVLAAEPGPTAALRHLSVHTADAAPPAAPDSAGHSLVGVLVTGGAELVLEGVLVSAGDASAGGVASPGGAGAAAMPDCTLGNASCSNLPVGSPGPNGAPGDAGPAASPGTFDASGLFSPGDGADGSPGDDGAPGGKGGGATCISAPGQSGCITGCSPQCTPYYGSDPACSTAGRCGCGGKGGTGGNAGRGGGASVALLVTGDGSRATITASRLVSGAGGDGSAGGAGGPGGGGSKGKAGMASGWCIQQSCLWDGTKCQVDQSVNTAPAGGAGGPGGTGGLGGAGSAGAGGPSIAAAAVAGGKIDAGAGATLLPGSGGAGMPQGQSLPLLEQP